MADRTRVVIIEDDIAIAGMYQFKLKQSGYDVRSANDGKTGLELTSDFKPSLILLDLMMPEMTGEEMLEKLRGTQWGKDIKVIILTNISKDEAPSKLRFYNIERYIVKAHYTPTQVAKIVEEVLASSAQRK